MLDDHVGPYIRVATHDLPFILAQRARLVQDIVTNSNLSEVVQRAGSSNQLDFTITKLQVFPQFARELRYSNRVGLGIPIASVKRLCG
jgi:hypothetical protein